MSVLKSSHVMVISRPQCRFYQLHPIASLLCVHFNCAALAPDLKVEHSATGLSFQCREGKNTECKGSLGVIARSCLKKKERSINIYLECFKNTLYKHSPSHVALLPRTRTHLTVPELVLLLESQPIWFLGVGRILPVCMPCC